MITVKFSTNITCLLLAVLSAGSCIAQEYMREASADKYRAVYWGLNDGLSQACVYQMRQDV